MMFFKVSLTKNLIWNSLLFYSIILNYFLIPLEFALGFPRERLLNVIYSDFVPTTILIINILY
jgi:hypothetical protein